MREQTYWCVQVRAATGWWYCHWTLKPTRRDSIAEFDRAVEGGPRRSYTAARRRGEVLCVKVRLFEVGT